MNDSLRDKVHRATVNRHFDDTENVHRHRFGPNSQRPISLEDEAIARQLDKTRFNILQQALRKAVSLE